MLKVATAQEMQQIDSRTIEKYGIDGTVLMERAGLSVVARINELLTSRAELRGQGKVMVLAGGGNNGGDGLVIARLLHNQGTDVEVYLSVPPRSLRGDARINYRAARKFGVRISPISSFMRGHRSCSILVDALLGTGLSREVSFPLSGTIRKINRVSCPVVSVDIPSGISSDTGQEMGFAVKADLTVTFGLPKRGHLLHPGAAHAGRLVIEEIGFPRTLLESDRIRVNLVQKGDISSLIPPRPVYSHKGTYGHVLIVAGSRGKTGAALMAARACLRSGAGLVTIGIPETLVNAFQSRVTEEMILPLPDRGDGTLSAEAAGGIAGFLEKKGTVLAFGPGLGSDQEIVRLAAFLIKKCRVPMVIDADGLNAIAGNVHLLRQSRVPVILTPHAGEMARLMKKGPVQRGKRSGDDDLRGVREELQQDRIHAAMFFAKANKVILVLKGAPTVTATQDGEAFVNSSGNPGMATAGTGDVLTGMISSLLAQGLAPCDAAVAGVYLHGAAGDMAAGKTGQRSLTASDINRLLPRVFGNVCGNAATATR
ncbi:MAG: NAD(P)H-hydrate dehydratase [Nitrospiraceae bacterium]|nr:MAG: NAD(P)H-hydrate dehydratase [Nitrospiraceae bacterium]